MKVKDFIEAEKLEISDGNQCLICLVHETMYEKREEYLVECPHCGKENIHYYEFDDVKVVGETNGGIEDENIWIWPVDECSKCGKPVAFVPTPINYNANHDVYYTGGKKYVTQKIEFGDSIKSLIEDYEKRKAEGEDLNSDYLNKWIGYEIEGIIATFLYENGFKK
jgi:hypothetical protein